MENYTSLKNLFTDDKFSFMEQLDSDIESSKKLLEETKCNKELINNLSNFLNTSSETDQSTIQNTKNISKLIDYNIEILKATNEISNSIKQDFVDILVKTDENNNSKFDYSDEMFNFKNKIAKYSAMLEKSNPVIFDNNKKISEFFENSDIKKYLNSFSQEYTSNENINNSIPEQLVENKSFTSIEENNNILLVSEKDKKVYLPYSKEEVLEYMKQYPNKYSSFNDVVRNEFIFPSDIYLKHTLASRFRETYSLMRDREAKTILESFKYAIEIMFRYDLNPTIIAACKTQEQLENYINCLENNNLSNFKDFEIRFEVTPLNV